MPSGRGNLPDGRYRMKLKKQDTILISGLLAGSLLLGTALALGRTEGSTVVVSVEGEQVAAFSLQEDTTYCIEGVNDGHNDLVIQDGEVWLEDADCPDRLCVNQGSIRYAGESIICLPNKVSVTIVGTDDEQELDGVTF